MRFVSGHQFRKRPILEVAKPFKIDGVYCRLIPLTKGCHAIVWESDYKDLMEFGWHAHFAPNNGSYYAQRDVRQKNGRYKHLPMGNAILGLPIGKIVDHANGVTLDYRRSNLRPATIRENSWNAKVTSRNQLGVRGVSKYGNRFVTRFCEDGKIIHLGSRGTLEEAQELYQSHAKERRGEFVRSLNG